MKNKPSLTWFTSTSPKVCCIINYLFINYYLNFLCSESFHNTSVLHFALLPGMSIIYVLQSVKLLWEFWIKFSCLNMWFYFLFSSGHWRIHVFALRNSWVVFTACFDSLSICMIKYISVHIRVHPATPSSSYIINEKP